MCCIFTCCGWMIDLVQRLWTFTMSCCISSAVCCSLITASLSGIALGYNYSLAEYIDLKETNVSVYLKRGVFDDEIADDMDFRRAGHMPVAGHLASANLRTGAPEQDETPVRSGRRLDDSVFGSEEQNKFEGSLMKLTAKPLDITGANTGVSHDLEMAEVIEKYPSGSIDQMKAVQSLINMRKSNVGLTTPKIIQKPNTDARDMPPYGPGLLGPNQIGPGPGPMVLGSMVSPPGSGPVPGPDPFPGSGRRIMPYDRSVYRYLNPARIAVPDPNINQRSYWQYPKVPEKYFPFNAYDDESNIVQGKQTYPPAITLNLGPIRPTRKFASETIPPPTTIATPEESIRRKLPGNEANVKSEDESQKFKDSILLNKFDMPSFQNEDVMKAQEGAQKSGDEDYEVEADGAPVRRKRFTKVSRKPTNYFSHTADLTESRTISELKEENSFLYKLTRIYDKTREEEIQNYFRNRNKRHALVNMDGFVGEFITEIVKLPVVS